MKTTIVYINHQREMGGRMFQAWLQSGPTHTALQQLYKFNIYILYVF